MPVHAGSGKVDIVCSEQQIPHYDGIVGCCAIPRPGLMIEANVDAACRRRIDSARKSQARHPTTRQQQRSEILPANIWICAYPACLIKICSLYAINIGKTDPAIVIVKIPSPADINILA